MVEGGGCPEFPVFFFDGEKEMNIGEVRVNPTLEYKPFQHILSKKIGISPNQISIYLVYRRKNTKSPFSEDRRRIPITGKVNFGLICRQKECCFLVVLKRSRKTRNRREKVISGLEFTGLLPGSEFFQPEMHSVPDNLVLLRRNQQVPYNDQIMQLELTRFNDRLQSLGARRESYQMAMARGNSYFHSSDRNSAPGTGTDVGPNYDEWNSIHPSTMIMKKTDIRKEYCEECLKAEKNGFHPCVNDPVVTRLISRFAPISRPNKPDSWL